MTEEEKQARRKEIVSGIKGHLDEISKLSNEILELENAYGVNLAMSVHNLMGNCKVALSVQTSGEDSRPNFDRDMAGATNELASLGIPKEILDIAVQAMKESFGIDVVPPEESEKPSEPADPPNVMAEKLIAAMTEVAKQKRGDPPAEEKK